MMYLKPDGRIDLEHRANFFLRGAPHQSVVVAAAEDGQVSIVSPDLQTVQLRRLSSRIRAVCPHPSNRRLAWVEGGTGALTIQNFDGTQPLEIPPPQLQEDSPNWLKKGFADCHFDEGGEFLWLAAPRSAEECKIHLLESGSGSFVDKTTIRDPFGGSSYSFHSSGRPGLISLWLATGQDGQQVYWLKRTRNGFSCTLERHLTNTSPPVFSPSGTHVLVVNENFSICNFDFPDMRQSSSPLKSEDEDNPFSESLCFLNERQALAGTNEQRIFVVDTVQMRVEEEVAIEGHEPRPIGEYYPTLAKETGLGTDISHFARLGDVIIFVYRRDRRTGLAGWKDSLLWLSIKGRE